MRLNHSHQASLFDPKLARTVHLIGAGSVGSWVAVMLARVGITDIHVWDGDSVASHNVPMSAYGKDDVGKVKVIALRELIERETGVRITTHEKMYEGEPLRNASVISCVDTMVARSVIWNAVKRKPTIDFFGDTRLNAAFIDILSIAPCKTGEIKDYETLSFSDEDAQIQVCGMHGIVLATSRAAGIVVANLTRFWTYGMKEWRVTERCDTLQRVF